MNKETVILNVQRINTRGGSSWLELSLDNGTKIHIDLSDKVQMQLVKSICGNTAKIQIPATVWTKEKQ